MPDQNSRALVTASWLCLYETKRLFYDRNAAKRYWKETEVETTLTFPLINCIDVSSLAWKQKEEETLYKCVKVLYNTHLLCKIPIVWASTIFIFCLAWSMTTEIRSPFFPRRNSLSKAHHKPTLEQNVTTESTDHSAVTSHIHFGVLLTRFSNRVL